ncbi:hypothetical protein EVG18_37480 [Burkholderia pyrrocinia]|nr:hypothetical protein EVG18_37480 [Burkholderia pyrrocinia]
MPQRNRLRLALFSHKTYSRSRHSGRYPVHGASQQPRRDHQTKNDKVRFCRTGHTAGTTVLYEDRLST